jgi:hypothetical protein
MRQQVLSLITCVALYKMCHPQQTSHPSAALPNLGGGWRALESTKAWLMIFVENGHVPNTEEILVDAEQCCTLYCEHLKMLLKAVHDQVGINVANI